MRRRDRTILTEMPSTLRPAGKIRILQRAIAGVALACASTALALEPPVYTVEEVPLPDGVSSVQASVGQGINSKGDVAGWVRGGLPSPQGSILRFQDGGTDFLSGPTGFDGQAFDINNEGQLVGFEDGSSGRRAFLIDDNGSVTLGTLGGSTSQAFAINDSGDIVGQSESDGPDPIRRPFLYHDNIMRDLGGLRGNLSPGSAHDINSEGTAVGESDGRAVIFRDGQVIDVSGQLPPPGSTAAGEYHSILLAVNDTETAVGQISNRPFNYGYPNGGYGAIFKDGKVIPIYGEGFGGTTADDINAEGDIVGSVDGQVPSDPQAFVYIDGYIYRLAELVAPGTPTELTPRRAYAINDAGAIAGFAYPNCERAIVLHPTSATRPNTVATPDISPRTGLYAPASRKVTLTCSTPGAQIRYSYGGAPVTETSQLYKKPIDILQPMVNARAFKAGMTPSPMVSVSIASETPRAATPVITPGAGTYPGTVKITIKCPTKGVRFAVTFDGTEPHTQNAFHENGDTIFITESTIVKAIAVSKGKTAVTRSVTATAEYSIGTASKTAAAPVFSLPAGTYPKDTKLKLTTPTREGTIQYSMSYESETGTPDRQYHKPVKFDSTPTGRLIVRARTVAPGYNPSPIVSTTYQITR